MSNTKASKQQTRIQSSVSALQEHLAEEGTVEAELRVQAETLVEARAAAELQQQRYQQLFELAPDSYIVTNLEGIIKMANRVAARMLNIEAHYLAHKPLAIYIMPDERTFFRKQLNLLREGTVERWETNLRPRDLPALNVMMSVVRSYSPVADSSELLWHVQDLTEYKQRQKAEREQYFRATFEQSPVGMAHIGADGTWLRVNPKLRSMLGYNKVHFQPLTIFEHILAKEDSARMRASISKLATGRADTARKEVSYQSKSGNIIQTLTHMTAVRSTEGRFLYAIVVMEDITERKRMEAAEHAQRLLAETLQNTALALASSLDFSEVTNHILTNIERLVPHDAASLLLIKDAVAYVERARGYGPEAESLEKNLQDFHIAVAESDRIMQMLRTKNAVLLPLWEDHGSWDQVPGMAAMRSLLAVPILERNEVLGFLKLHSRTPNFFTEAHARLLQAFAVQAAIAIQNAHAHEDAQALAAQNERHRLARELHDAVTQTLFSANVIADSIPRLWPEVPDPVQTQLQQLQLLTRGALGEMRILLLELRPEYLANMDLAAQLRQLLDAVQARKRLEVTFTAQVDVQIPPAVRIAFYRIAQEALNNIVKHAHANEICIELSAHEVSVELLIQDDGTGFDYPEQLAGFGLHTMRERAEEVGAELNIITHPQAGTCVRVVWGEPKQG